MKRVLTALVLIPIVLVIVFLGPKQHWLFSLAVAGVAAAAGWEYLGLTQQRGAHPPRIVVIAALLTLFFANFEWPDRTPDVFGILTLALLILCTFRKPVEQVMIDASACIFCMFYIGFTLLTLISLHEQPNGPSLVVFLFCVVWAGDSFALYTGRAWGKHKLAPGISPGKSWEGSIGSVVGSLIAAGILLELASQLQARDIAVLSYPDEPWYWLVLAVIVNIAAQVGDLAESALKRSAGVKDSGTLLPGHGGMLDRIDALLLASPVLWYAQAILHRF
ncbi:MAG TPA: phosphatidate cytidylyltransferase [Terracidiphilus sp.]|nr:phosphatidate cytidylyltransferase [Terracidiphilus sp.]